jgi:hypothetical protein
MRKVTLLGVVLIAVVSASCSSTPEPDEALSTPEGAVVTWFEAIDSGDAEAASYAIHPESLALILAIENDISTEQLADHLSAGVPLEIQSSYWRSFSLGFTDFAAKPISTLSVGRADRFVSEGEDFASIPISGGPGSDSVVIARMRADGTWEVDMVASLGDGFSKLLLERYDELGSDEAAARVRLAYIEVVAPSMWAAMADGSFGETFATTALTILARIAEDNA